MYVWEDNLKTCEQLLLLNENENNEYSDSIKEGINRTIISKCYYACFNKIVELNDVYGLISNEGGKESHINAIDLILQYPSNKDITNSEKARIVREMRSLKDARVKADYNLGNNFMYKNSFVKNIYEKAASIFKALDKV